MAVFGAQFAISMIMATLLHKFSTHFSLGTWLLTKKLVRYLYPTDTELRNLAGLPNRPPSSGNNKNRGKKGSRHNTEGPSSTGQFLVPKQLCPQLDGAEVREFDLWQLQFSSEWQRLLDIATGALGVYLLTEAWQWLAPPSSSELNLSLMWLMVVVLMALKMLLSLTSLYFRSQEATGERSLCLSAGFLFLFLAMVVLVVDENVLELGLEPAFDSFNSSARNFLQNQGINSNGPASQLMCKLGLALWSGIMGALLTFPGLRFARMHIAALKYCQESPLLGTILNINFVAPLLVALMWFKPIARDYFCIQVWPGMSQPLLSGAAFESLRLWLLVGTAVLRMALLRPYLQAHLNLAPEKVGRLQKEAGRISNIDLQRTVAQVFYYLCVVALQYVIPLLLLLFSTLLLKSLGDYTWLQSSAAAALQQSAAPHVAVPLNLSANNSIVQTSQQLSLALANLRQVFSPAVYRGLLGYATWWLCSLWFATSAVGLAYHSYFE